MARENYTYRPFIKGFLQGYETLPISSLFGKRYIRGGISPHDGIDIAVPVGTVLKAPIDGVIMENRVQEGKAGKFVSIRATIPPDVPEEEDDEVPASTGLRVYVLMMHLHSVDDNIVVGKQIKAGDRIGTTGGDPTDQPNAGSSQGPHLHFEVRRGVVAVDPLFYFLANHKVVAKEDNRVLFDPAVTPIKSFKDVDLKDQSVYTYSRREDLTIINLTECDPPKKKKKQKTSAKERLAPGIWQITKLLIDSSVSDKQVLDAGISTQQGSLLNYFKKVCQEPLVEFMGDTFGNQYYWIVRKPPYDKEGFLKMIDLTMTYLPEKDVYSTSLAWNNQGIYSWYRYMPYADLFSQQLTAAIPAVFFPEFASVWGSRPLCVESNYFNWEFSGRHDTEKPENSMNADRIWQNAIRDFKFIIESNAYAPFTRRGTITMVGDRKIKRGTLVCLSGEVFYVDAVTNNYDVTANGVTRTTTLQVSRGMFKRYIDGYEKITSYKDHVTYSYFNIIDFGKDFKIENITAKNWKSYVSKWKVDIDNFGFFMSRQQVYLEKMQRKFATVKVDEVETERIDIGLENGKYGTIYSR